MRVQDEAGSALPAKVSAVGIYGPEGSTLLTRHFLFDLQAGERFRPSDLVDDDPSDPETRKYVEQTAFTDRGTATLIVRPGTYRIVAAIPISTSGTPNTAGGGGSFGTYSTTAGGAGIAGFGVSGGVNGVSTMTETRNGVTTQYQVQNDNAATATVGDADVTGVRVVIRPVRPQ